jgi:hypothetical protein
MGAPSRRYPRIEIDKQAALDFRLPSRGRMEPELVRIPVAIRSISCEGVGLALCDQRWPLSCGTSVTLYFVVDSQRFEIPGRVVWLAPQQQPSPIDAGVHFQLALAGSTVRQSYATWIVDLIVRSRETSPPRRVLRPVPSAAGSTAGAMVKRTSGNPERR